MNIVAFSDNITPATSADCILRDICTAIEQRRDVRPLQKQAIQIFAGLNGFKSRGMRRYAFDQDRICDHAIHLGGALIGQPYANAYRDKDWRQIGEDIAAEHDLAFHVPPIPTASIWLPGSTLFLAFTKPGHEIRWLPEQVHGIVDVK